MATQTTNYGLKKPSYSDTADIGVINSNMDIIDAKMKEIDDKAGSGGGGTSVTVDSELSTTSENPVQNKVVTQALNGKGTYSKPTGGIPKTDLASGVQTSLGKADTALQKHQDISGKANKADLTALSNSISDAWKASTTYKVGQYCIYNNSLWKCLVQHKGQTPKTGTYWTKVSVGNEITSVNNSLVDKASNSDFITVTGTTGSQINVESQIPYPAGVSATTHCVVGFSCQYSNNNYYSATGLVSVSGNPDCIIVMVSNTGYCNKPIKIKLMKL